LIIEPMKALPVKKLPAGSSNVLEVPTTHQGRRSPHISSCGKLLNHDEKIAFCNTDLLIAMSIQSGFPDRDTLQLRKTG
jgi:hypothetical protein